MNDTQHIRDCIRRMAIGPKASKDLTREECSRAMGTILSGGTSDVTASVFLMGLRLKRETLDENLGVLDALRGASLQWTSSCEEIVDIADPYDGFHKKSHWTLYRAALLGAMGVPVVVHGGTQIPPKYGTTARDLIAFHGKLGMGAVSLAGTKACLDACGWTYADLRTFCPGLESLRHIRHEMVKRTCLATVEKLILPIRGTEKTGVVTGYVHSGYEGVLQDILRASGVAWARVVRGPEGHTSFHGFRETRVVGYPAHMKPSEVWQIARREGAEQGRAFVSVEESAKRGLAALAPGAVTEERTQIVEEAAAIMGWSGRVDSELEGIECANRALDSGEALKHFERGISLLCRGEA